MKIAPALLLSLIAVLHVAPAASGSGAVAPYEWEPGSVFREHTFNGIDPATGKPPTHHVSELDPGTKRPEHAARLPNTRAPRLLTLAKAGVERAELLPEYWGGHLGTTGWLQLNRRGWIPLPRPVGTPEAPEGYYHTVLGNRAVPLRVQDLLEGENTFRFTAGPQIYGSFDWGFYWLYAFTVRLYHPRSAEHPSAVIANVAAGATLMENPEITVTVQPGAAPIERVDVFAWYEDFNYSGSGCHREWHGQLNYGRPRHHVGSATAAPWTVRWNTEWVPDQPQPIRLVARVVDAAGWHTVTPVVENVRLARTGRRVQLVTATDVPRAFGVRIGRELACTLHVPELPARPARARLMLSSWSGAHAERIRFNDTQLPPKIGRVHDYAVDAIEVPPEAVRPGRNEFAIFSATTHHAAEVNWPGPVLLLEFGGR